MGRVGLGFRFPTLILSGAAQAAKASFGLVFPDPRRVVVQ
jgi:hypothetical protein